ncbi:hypothetical protein EOL96_06585 [Candidatus Saccharibacteria bacterium]|nr:hypothetical protein [Candidatus Saccharibacteria bacterium]
MSNEPAEQKQSISDDQELAKVLAGINDTTDNQSSGAAEGIPTPPPLPPAPGAPADASAAADSAVAPAPNPAADPNATATDDGGPLDVIKQQALGELRPLVDKLQVEPDEKFDIYLLLLRSTDDKDLIAPAHEAAKLIPDESKRAQALLDIIKEIDFLSQPKAA